MERVTMSDCSVRVIAFIEGIMAAEALIEWAREAMGAREMPKDEHKQIMELLQDISMSNPSTLHQAIKHYKKLIQIP